MNFQRTCVRKVRHKQITGNSFHDMKSAIMILDSICKEKNKF